MAPRPRNKEEKSEKGRKTKVKQKQRKAMPRKERSTGKRRKVKMKEKRKREEEQMRRSERRRGTDNFSDAAEAAGQATSGRRAVGMENWQKGESEQEEIGKAPGEGRRGGKQTIRHEESIGSEHRSDTGRRAAPRLATANPRRDVLSTPPHRTAAATQNINPAEAARRQMPKERRAPAVRQMRGRR
jgi:hypothetical protein